MNEETTIPKRLGFEFVEMDEKESGICPCLEEVLEFISPDTLGHAFLMFLNEILKNIRDHAGGKGYLLLEDLDGVIHFEINDFTGLAYDLEVIRAQGTSKPGSGRNFGIGICGEGIADLAAACRITYTLDTSCGFLYKGIYHPQRPSPD